MNRISLPFLFLMLASLLAACAPAAAAQPVNSAAPAATLEPTPAASFTDPFAYCQAVGTADTPGPKYTGPKKMTEPLAQAIKKASGASEDAPLEMFLQGSFWRCMDGKVYGCFVGANLPCESKANTDSTPTAAENEYCAANPQSDFIPAAVTGHETVFEWRCKNGQAEAGKQLVEVDGRGFIAGIWYPLPAP